MDAVIKPWPKGSPALSDHVRAAPQPVEPRPTREQAEEAVRTLIAYAGDDPAREGLLETPKRVIGTFDEIYRGYGESPAEVLDRTFSEIGSYDDLVLVRDIPFYSHCEHHVMPFTGKACRVSPGGRGLRRLVDGTDAASSGFAQHPCGCARPKPASPLFQPAVQLLYSRQQPRGNQ